MKRSPEHVVVDGSNLATEGRSLPSLTQLNEAVMSFMEEHPDTAITVVVDATFGHRIDKKEVAEFEEGIANNELVAPPAGAVGRGDAFVLGIADKANSSVLSNDSFQEFHGDYAWLFDEGRLIGGKPVPHVGWVWVDRVPVRGPVSRKATKGTASSGRSRGGRGRSRTRASDDGQARIGSPDANAPMPVPTSPPPGGASADESAPRTRAAKKSAPTPAAGRRAPTSGEPVNELLPFLEFVEHHPAGTAVDGTVDSYSSHGAYVTIGNSGIRGYVPLRLMADPPPRSAKATMKVGETVSLVVVSYAAERRSIDCALPAMADAALAAATASAPDVEQAAAAVPDAAEAPDQHAATKTTATAKKSRAKKTAAKKTAAKKSVAKESVAKKSAAKKAAAAKKSADKKTGPEAAVKKVAEEKSAVKKTAAKKTAAKKTVDKKTAAKKQSAATGLTVKKVAVKKTPVKKAPAKQIAAKKTATRKTATKKAAAKKTATRKTATKKTATRKTATKKEIN